MARVEICLKKVVHACGALDSFRRRDYMPPRPRQPRRLLLIRIRLTRVPHELVEAMPERGDGIVFFGHSEDFFELAVENVG